MRGLADGCCPGEDTAKDDDARRLWLLALGPTGVLDLDGDANEAGGDDEYPVGRYHFAGLVAAKGGRLIWEFDARWVGIVVLGDAMAWLWYKAEATLFEAFVGRAAGAAAITKSSKQMLYCVRPEVTTMEMIVRPGG